MYRIALSLCLVAGCGVAAWAQGPYSAIASSKQLMAGSLKPAMDGLATMLKAGGPKDEKEWAMAESQAAALAETAQLLLLANRPLDQDVWLTSSRKLQDAGVVSMKAAGSKDLAAWKTSLSSMGAACKSCHSVHKKNK
ncbi:MAG: hypothetical protein IPM24_12630 [Bryobacterales bacterium]|jgi:cytochrome c556|nr:hypothetical protein [Bryobacterales bacterium]